MPELRKDPVVDRWVIFASGRTLRPSDFGSAAPVENRGRPPCPFCYGNEEHTPPELLAYRDRGSAPNGIGWRTRVVPNKFPALRVEGGLERRGEGIYDRMNGIGAHEVIVESPDHDKELSELPVEDVERILTAYRERMADLKNDLRLRYILLFKNHGERAGASLAHGHSQLIATPIIPQVIAEELEGGRRHFDLKERCVFCDMLDHELRNRKRLVLENDRYVSIEPFAPRAPFETWILPKRHLSAFEEAGQGEYRDLAALLKETLTRIRKALNRPHYNYVLHTAPCREPRLDHYHWHIEILPKRNPLAGFEWGSGFYINPTPPEEAAEYLRGLTR
jgi:UDPglucose--hexose-1-phosphate uridylyltransferase